MANQTSITYSGTQQGGAKVTTTIAYVNPDATDNQLIELAEKVNGLTTNTVDDVTKISKRILIETEDPLPRNLTVTHLNQPLTEIQAADLPLKTASDGQYLINITFAGTGEDELWIRNVMERTGEVYICCVQGANAQSWILDLRKNNTPSGYITIEIPATATYEAAVLTLPVIAQ